MPSICALSNNNLRPIVSLYVKVAASVLHSRGNCFIISLLWLPLQPWFPAFAVLLFVP
jgi:hypothetical protein